MGHKATLLTVLISDSASRLCIQGSSRQYVELVDEPLSISSGIHPPQTPRRLAEKFPWVPLTTFRSRQIFTSSSMHQNSCLCVAGQQDQEPRFPHENGNWISNFKTTPPRIPNLSFTAGKITTSFFSVVLSARFESRSQWSCYGPAGIRSGEVLWSLNYEPQEKEKYYI